MNKHTFQGMLTFLLLLTFYSCKKENNTTLTPIVEPEFNTRIYSDQIAQFQIFLKDLLTLTVEKSLEHPELLGLKGEHTAQTRTGCPCTSVTDTGGGFPKILTLDFGAVGSGCTSGNDYEGKFIVTFESDIYQFKSGFLGTEVLMEFEDFSINGFNISNGNASIQFEYDGTFGYDVFLFDDVVVEKNGVTTTYKKALEPTPGSPIRFGSLSFEDPIGDDDDQTPPAPIAFLNDVFVLNITSGNLVCCTSGANTTNFCIETSSPIKFQPAACGCITNGTLVAKNSIGGTCTNINATYFFDSDAGGANNGNCDSFVSVDNSVVTFTGHNCP